MHYSMGRALRGSRGHCDGHLNGRTTAFEHEAPHRGDTPVWGGNDDQIDDTGISGLRDV